MTNEEALELQPGAMVTFNNDYGKAYGFPPGTPIAVERVEQAGSHVRIWNYYPKAAGALWTSAKYMDRVSPSTADSHANALLEAFNQ